ncbi:hypothetical protein [Streptomyces sp. NPDC001815]|uniref:MmyB family transcriptional regulator n=1 Tax=Streptomyces sp. NPDC001815 TaxID=3154526 RepID=UPI00332387C5
MSTRSEIFRGCGRHDVRAHGRGIKRFQHPVVGAHAPGYGLLQPAVESGLTVIIYMAEPGTASHDNLAVRDPGGCMVVPPEGASAAARAGTWDCPELGSQRDNYWRNPGANKS